MKQSSGKQPTVENGHLKKPAVIAAFKGCASVTKACEIADICRDTFYRWLKEDPEFREAFEKSREEAAQLLEDEAARRAYEGVERPVDQGGKQVGVVREYSDTLLIFLLKGARPQKYRDNIRQEITGANGTPLPPTTINFVAIPTPSAPPEPQALGEVTFYSLHTELAGVQKGHSAWRYWLAGGTLCYRPQYAYAAPATQQPLWKHPNTGRIGCGSIL